MDKQQFELIERKMQKISKFSDILKRIEVAKKKMDNDLKLDGSISIPIYTDYANGLIILMQKVIRDEIASVKALLEETEL